MTDEQQQRIERLLSHEFPDEPQLVAIDGHTWDALRVLWEEWQERNETTPHYHDGKPR